MWRVEGKLIVPSLPCGANACVRIDGHAYCQRHGALAALHVLVSRGEAAVLPPEPPARTVGAAVPLAPDK